LSLQVLQEFHVTITRKIASPLPIATSIRLIRNFAIWPIHRPDADDIVAAAQIQDENQLSFWDAMIMRSAQQLQCSVVWSEDLNSGQRIQGVTILSPFATG
jgi:predicted nucleic acid-binding protein